MQRCLDDRDTHIIAEAARTLAIFGVAAEGAIPRLLDMLWRGETPIKIGAAEALGAIRSRAEIVVPELSVLLTDGNAEVVAAAARALRQFGHQAASAVPHLLATIKSALVGGQSVDSNSLIATLQVASEEPEQLLCDHFADPELRRNALEALRQLER